MFVSKFELKDQATGKPPLINHFIDSSGGTEDLECRRYCHRRNEQTTKQVANCGLNQSLE
jgi:hypothetical protein